MSPSCTAEKQVLMLWPTRQGQSAAARPGGGPAAKLETWDRPEPDSISIGTVRRSGCRQGRQGASGRFCSVAG